MVGSVIGCATLLIAATIGLVVTDLKRVIAYSTMSQIGYMIMAVVLRGVRGGHVPPDDARLLQGAALHGGRLGHRRDGRQPGPGPDGRLPQGRCRSRSAAWSSAASRCRASRRSRASSPRTRSSRYMIDRGGWYIVLAILGYVGALMTAFYTFRMIFRAFSGEMSPEAERALPRPPLPRARADQPGQRRGRGHRGRLPRPGAPHRRARPRHEDRDGRRWPCSRSSAAPCRSRA